MTNLRLRALALGALLGLAVPASAIPTDQYLKLRRQNDFDARVTYAHVELAPGSYSGKVFEMRGRVDGYVRREENVSFLLTLVDTGKGVFLEAPGQDQPLVANGNHQVVRVLSRVKTGMVGNVVPLEVLAIANDAEVAQREREAEAAAPQRARQAPAAAPNRSSDNMPSRGYAARRTVSPEALGLSSLAARVLSPEAQEVYAVYKSFIWNHNRRLTADEADKITVSVLHFSQRFKVDPRLAIAMIIAESDFDPKSTSNKGAMGLGQLMPDEVRSLHLSNPYDPIQNVQGAVDLLRGKLDKYKSEPLPDGIYSERQIMLALAAYNAGSGAVRKYGGIPPYRETQNYVRKIMRIYRQLIGAQ